MRIMSTLELLVCLSVGPVPLLCHVQVKTTLILVPRVPIFPAVRDARDRMQMRGSQCDAQYHEGREIEVCCSVTTREAVMMITQLHCMRTVCQKLHLSSIAKASSSGNSECHDSVRRCSRLHAHAVGSRLS